MSASIKSPADRTYTAGNQSSSSSLPDSIAKWRNRLQNVVCPLLDRQTADLVRKIEFPGHTPKVVSLIAKANTGVVPALEALLAQSEPAYIFGSKWKLAKVAIQHEHPEFFRRAFALTGKEQPSPYELAILVKKSLDRNSVENLQKLAKIIGVPTIWATMNAEDNLSLRRSLVQAKPDMKSGFWKLLAEEAAKNPQFAAKAGIKLDWLFMEYVIEQGQTHCLRLLHSDQQLSELIKRKERYRNVLDSAFRSPHPVNEMQEIIEMIPRDELMDGIKPVPGTWRQSYLAAAVRWKKAGSEDACLKLLRLMMKDELILHLRAKGSGGNFLEEILRIDNVILLDELFGRLGEADLVDPDNYGPKDTSLLADLARYDATDCLNYLVEKLSPKNLRTMFSDLPADGTAVHYAVGRSSKNLDRWLALYSEMGADITRKSLEACPDQNLFREALFNKNPAATKACVKFYELAGLDPTHYLNQEIGEESHIESAIRRGLPQALPPLIELSGKEPSKLLTLTCLQVDCPALLELLKARYPSAPSYEQALLRMALNTPSQIGKISMRSEYLEGVSDDTVQILKGEGLGVLKTRYPKLGTGLENLEKALSPGRDRWELKQRIAYRRQLSVALSLHNLNTDLVESWAPLLLEVATHDSSCIRLRVCELVARHQLSLGGQSVVTPARLQKAAKRNQPASYLIALHALQQRGVNRSLIHALYLKVAKMGQRLRENTPEGEAVLKMLTKLALETDLSNADINRLIQRMCYGDFLENGYAIYRLLQLGELELLRLPPQASTLPDLPLLALTELQKYLPGTNAQNFEENYKQFFGSQRRSQALWTYFHSIAHKSLAVEDLAKFVNLVFSGNFQTGRYAADENPHLQEVYRQRPDLAQRLPTLVTDMGSFGLANPNPSKDDTDFTIHASGLRTALLLNSKEDLPHLHKFVKAETAEERKALRAEFTQLIRNSKKDDKDYARLQLENSLMKLYQKSCTIESLIREGRSEQRQRVMMLRKEFGSDLKNALMLRASLQVKSSIFSYLDLLLKEYEERPNIGFEDFEVALTDNYWDLLLIGTEVQGSCLRVDGKACSNKGLLSYVMDGKTVPIVVRKPGKKETVARQLLRIELDANTGQPVLYLDTLYSNYKNPAIKNAIRTMAERVASELKLPLYSEAKYGNSVHLKALKGRVHYLYVDPEQTNKRDKGVKYHATLLFDHRKQAAQLQAASSSWQVFQALPNKFF